MARLSKADLLTRYRNRVERSRRWRDEEGYDALWARMIDLYRGRHFEEPLGTEDRIAVNIAFGTVNVIVPSISVNYPKFTVQPTREEDQDRAWIVEATTNYWWRHYDFQDEFRRAAKDYVIIGHGWVKVAWRYREGQERIDEDEILEEIARRIAEADQFAADNPDRAGEVPSDEEIAANVAQFRTVALEDRPVVERVSPFDIFVDTEATHPNDMRWIAQRVQRPLEDVKEDERYKPSVRKKLQADATTKAGEGDKKLRWRERLRRDQDDTALVTVWEFYDLENNTVCHFAESGEGFLSDPQPIPFAYGHPFVMFRNYDVPDQFYPMGDLEQIEALQHELNKTRSQMMNHRKRYARKYLYREGTLGPQGREAIESDQDNRLIPVADPTTPLNDVIVPLQQTQLAPEIYNHSTVIRDDMDTVSGVNEYARGGAPNIRRTATEAAIIQDAINARSADKLAQIELVLARVARRLVQVMQQFLEGEAVARLNGPDSKVLWVPYTRHDIKGEFDFQVEAGSTQPTNETFRRQNAMALMNTMAPLVGTIVDPVELAKHVLQQGFGIKNPSKFILQQQMPMDPMAAAAGGLPTDPAALEPEEPEVEDEDGIPDAIANQLAGQVGLMMGGV